jgi:hypothetical protein
MRLIKRKQRETLTAWLERAMIKQLDDGKFIDALWTAQLVSRIKAERERAQ